MEKIVVILRIHLLSMRLNAKLVTLKALCVVEIERKNEAGTFEHNHFVVLVLPCHISLNYKIKSIFDVESYWSSAQKVGLLFEFIHCAVKVVEELVTQHVIIDQVPLSTTVMVRLIVA